MKRQDYKKMMQQKKAAKSFKKTALLSALSISMISLTTTVSAEETNGGDVSNDETYDNSLVFESDAPMAPDNGLVFEPDAPMAPDNGLVFEPDAPMAPDNGLMEDPTAPGIDLVVKPSRPENELVSSIVNKPIVSEAIQTIVVSTATTTSSKASELPQTSETTSKMTTSLIGLGLLGSSAIIIRRRSINVR